MANPQQSTKAAETRANSDIRSMFFQALNFEDHLDCFRDLQGLALESLSSTPANGKLLFRQNEDAEGRLRLLPVESVSRVIASRLDLSSLATRLDGGTEGTSVDKLRHAMAQLAPLIRIEGSHLAGAVSLKLAREASGAALLRSHARAVGGGRLESSRALAFEHDLNRWGLAFSPLSSAAFAADRRLSDGAFLLPTFLLALSHATSRFHQQILGVNLLLALVDPVAVLGGGLSSGRYSKLKREAAEADRADAYEAIESFLLARGVGRPPSRDDATAVERGFLAGLNIMKAFFLALERELADSTRFSPQGKVLRLIERLGTRPFGYHKKGRMNGEPIDHWFDPVRFKPADVVRALAKSSYIVPGSPENSRLLTQVTRADGPMFRIFSDDDLVIIADWIRDLPKTRAVTIEDLPTSPLPSLPADTSVSRSKAAPRVGPIDLSDMYVRLVNSDQNIDLWPQAKAFAETWLQACSWRLDQGPSPLPFSEYSHARLDAWLEQKHAQQVKTYIPLESYPEDAKEDVISTSLQLAPLTLIDGAWLRSMTAPAIVNSNVGSLLYNIYIDELGNGDTATHHGNIYTELIESMGHDMPGFATPEFSASKIIEERSLEVPVYWLSVSLFPRRFMSEILGLNLAMELSGVGGEYRRSGDILKYYGFSSQFTELHNTIDNIVTGHTAWAVDAIKLFLDDILQKGGRSLVQDHWRRIWIGYRSLQPPRKKPLIIEAISRLFDFPAVRKRSRQCKANLSTF